MFALWSDPKGAGVHINVIILTPNIFTTEIFKHSQKEKEKFGEPSVLTFCQLYFIYPPNHICLKQISTIVAFHL